MDPNPDVRIRKASQMAVSTYCIIWALWLCKTKQAQRGIAYWLPTDGDVSDFVKTKVDSFIRDNNDALPGILSNADSYNVGLKFLYGVPTYWRGLKSRSAVKSISADATIFDEFDECEPAQVAQARERMSASEAKFIRELSTPTIPDFGIDKRFQETDQCHVMFQCQKCNTYTCLEETFPECIIQDPGGKYYRSCMKCKEPLDLTKFEWVRKSETARARGYQISQLYSPWVNLNDLMHEYHTTEFPGHFHNHKIGLPWISAEDRVTIEQVLACVDPLHKMKLNSQKQTAMGIDVGSKLHCVVIEPGDKDKVLWIGELKDFEQIDHIAKALSVKSLVIDAMPEQRKVHELTKRLGRMGYACWYNDSQKDGYVWNDDKRTVSVNRTESLDAGTDSFHRHQIILPQQDSVVQEFAVHCANIVKTTEKDPETGDVRFTYKRIGPDHYRHAFNYAKIACSKLKSGGVASSWRR